jgi:hypothetical protein
MLQASVAACHALATLRARGQRTQDDGFSCINLDGRRSVLQQVIKTMTFLCNVC